MEEIITCNQAGSSSLNWMKDKRNNLQVFHILTAALKRSAEAVRFFENKGASSQRSLNRAFYLYLGVKKDAQRMILEKIAKSLGIELSTSCDSSIAHDEFKLYQEEYENIFNIIHEMTADELEFYLNYAAIEPAPKIKNLILMLAELSREFLFDVKIWYLNHKNGPYIKNAELQETQETASSGHIVEAVLY
jgi:hypothetical protein